MAGKIAIGTTSVLAVLVLASMAAPLSIEADSFRPELLREISAALGRPVEFGHVSLSLMSGRLSLEHISIADDPSFSRSPFATARSLEVGVDVLPLVFKRTLRVRSAALREPDVTLRRSRTGVWNFSTLGNADSARALSLDRLGIVNGRVTTVFAGAVKRRAYDDVSGEVRGLSTATRLPYHLTARALDSGRMVRIDGTLERPVVVPDLQRFFSEKN